MSDITTDILIDIGDLKDRLGKIEGTLGELAKCIYTLKDSLPSGPNGKTILSITIILFGAISGWMFFLTKLILQLKGD